MVFGPDGVFHADSTNSANATINPVSGFLGSASDFPGANAPESFAGKVFQVSEDPDELWNVTFSDTLDSYFAGPGKEVDSANYVYSIDSRGNGVASYQSGDWSSNDTFHFL